MKRSLAIPLSAVGAALIFWHVDVPATVRTKASIIKLLPLDPEILNESIYSACAGAHRGIDVASCFVSFYSREAAEVVEARERCRATVKKVEVDKEWVRLNPNPDEKKPQASYMYIGDDNAFKAKYGLAIFSADDCSLTSFAGGEVTLYKF